MSLRTHAVVVRPDQWTGAPADLARLLAPITGADLGPLTEALARGPMTVEADLSPADARALASRLSSMGVPAEIHPPADDHPIAPGGIATDPARVTDELPRSRSGTMVGMSPMAPNESDGSGWGAVFPDLKPNAGLPEPSEPLSLDELEDAPIIPAQPLVEKTPPLGSTPTATADVLPDIEAAPPSAATAKPAAQRPSRASEPGGFDPEKLSALMPADASEEERPPFAPRGYEGRPEHHPPFAVAFALLAPGAGHVFNGEDDEGLSIGLRFWMIVPWVRSVRQARERAEKIRGYWAPRPDDGSGLRAFRYASAWWLCIFLVGAALSWGIPVLSRVVNREPEQVGFTDEQIGSAFESAETRVLGGRVKALDALQFASKDLVPTPQYSMSKAERSERLFSLGYRECERRAYRMCEQMMKRILELRPAFGSAIKLQAWASVAQRGARGAPMPDVGEVPTLNELELQKLRDEMVLQGEDVPPPSTATNAVNPPSVDAGSPPSPPAMGTDQ